MLSKQQAKMLFLIGTFVTFAIFIGLTVYSLSLVDVEQPPLSESAARGKHIWEKNNCMGCHTVLGEGAYYAPELTNVYVRRGPDFIKAVLMSKSPWQPNGRKMVAYGMSEQEANDMVEFFKWTSQLDLNGFEYVNRKVSPLAAKRLNNKKDNN
jgi:nitric oxide reductase subunit C